MGGDATAGSFLAYLLPGLHDAISFVGRLTRLSVPRLVAIAVVGRVPGVALAAFALVSVGSFLA